MKLFKLDTLSPVAKLIAALIIAFALVPSIDGVSAGTSLILSVGLFLAAGASVRTLAVRGIPIFIAAAFTGLTILLYGQVSGKVHWSFLAITISDGSIYLAIVTTIRVLAIALPSIILFVNVDTTDLADGLAQVLRLPARFVLGALAGLRMISLLRQDWQYLGFARRARGAADRGRIRRFAGQAFALLVFAVRRGGKLATAMEARGFGAFPTRTWAREATLSRNDYLLIGAAVLISVISITLSITTGAWHFIGSR